METSAYIVLAELRAKLERVNDFAAYMDRHAAWSRQEPGCLTFEVCQDSQDSSVFWFYEAYTSEQAYQEHRKQPYCTRFNEGVRDMLVHSEDTLFASRRVLHRRPLQPAPP